MTELIEALRCRSNDIRQCEGCAFKDACYGGTLELIAADAIEHLKENVAHQQDAIERLMAEIDRKDKAIQGLLTQIERKDKTIERMRDLMKHYKAAYRTAYKLYQEARNEQQP